MYKIIGFIALIIIAYILLSKDAAPQYLYFQGEEFGPKELNTLHGSNSRLYEYHRKPSNHKQANHSQNENYLMLLYPNPETGSLQSWSNVFSRKFESQEFKFVQTGERKLGQKANVSIYMTPIKKENVLVMLVIADTHKTVFADANAVFDLLEQYPLIK